MEDYDGPREAKGIVKFVKEAVGITAEGSLTRLKTADETTALIAEGGAKLVGLFREPVSASAMFNVFAEVAGPIKAAFSASSSANAPAEALGIKTLPSVLLTQPHAAAAHAQLHADPSPRREPDAASGAALQAGGHGAGGDDDPAEAAGLHRGRARRVAAGPSGVRGRVSGQGGTRQMRMHLCCSLA